MNDYKIVSLEIEKKDKQISRLFKRIWPEKFLYRKIKRRIYSAKEITKNIHHKFRGLEEKIIVVYGSGLYHHYTVGLHKEAERKFGKNCYLHFDKHYDWGIDNDSVCCGGFVCNLVVNSLSNCIRAVGTDIYNDNHFRLNLWGCNYRGLEIFNEKLIYKNKIKNLIKNSNKKVYLSFDLDIMASGEIITGFGNGYLTIPNLVRIINIIKNEKKIVSADILGYSPEYNKVGREGVKYDVSLKEYFDSKSLVLYLIIAGELIGEDTKEFQKLHKFLKKKDDVRDMKTLLKCLG